jgi:hypothetical protein
MVGNTGTAPDTRRIRRLKLPHLLEVEASKEGVPLRLRLGGVWQGVTLIRRSWRIDQQWWRGEPVHRDYYHVAPQEGSPLSLYHDIVNGDWFRQEYR